jgi:hypothetical protein
MSEDTMALLLIFAIFFAYFAPTFIAAFRHHPNP